MNLLLNKNLSSSFIAPFKGYLSALANMATSSSIQSINYDELQKYMKNGAYIIDVREKQELLETGTLPSSVNIPVGEVEGALRLSDDEFVCKYGANKPSPDMEIVFSCRSGRRSEMAAQTTVKEGFSKVLNYSGGWLDWEKKSKS